MKKLNLKRSEILVLRNVKKNMKSYNGFKWPKEGHEIADDWIDNYKCGNGLHGLPWGVGCISYLYDEPSIWLVLKVDTSKDYNHGKGDMTDKCKFKECDIVFCGTREKAVELIVQYAPANLAINFVTQTAGDRSTQTAGDWSTQTAGDWSTQTAGVQSVQIIRYYKDGWKVKTRIITKNKANKWYIFENEGWRLLTDVEIKEKGL